jgi:N-acetylglucosamine-6-phosphate deacetylase
MVGAGLTDKRAWLELIADGTTSIRVPCAVLLLREGSRS